MKLYRLKSTSQLLLIIISDFNVLVLTDISIPQLLTKASKSMSIANTILLLAPILIMVVISELVLNGKMCSHILARAT